MQSLAGTALLAALRPMRKGKILEKYRHQNGAIESRCRSVWIGLQRVDFLSSKRWRGRA